MRCLALNASFEPLTMVPVRRALRLVIEGKAEIVDYGKRPLVVGEIIVAPTRERPMLAIKAGGRGDITNTHVAWRVPTGGPYVSSLVHYQGVIYMSTDNGILSAVDASNGQRLWQERVGGTFSASPIAGDGKIYFVSEGGETIVMVRNYDKAASRDVDRPPHAQPFRDAPRERRRSRLTAAARARDREETGAARVDVVVQQPRECELRDH